MKLTFHELKNFTSKIISKKSILILSSIVLIFLINACNPTLPTGGPVSPNNTYKIFNKEIIAEQTMASCSTDTINIDIDNDSIIDLYFTRFNCHQIRLFCTSDVSLASILDSNNNNIDTTDYYRIFNFNINQSINNLNNWNKNQGYVIYSYNWGIFLSEIQPSIGGTSIIGLKIKKGNEYHYAWLRLAISNLSLTTTSKLTIIESCYNTIPNQPILAGKK